jgi:hypothetical protein
MPILFTKHQIILHQMSKNTNITLDSTAQAWAEITIKTWLAKIQKLNIGSTQKLATSFVHHVITNSQGNPEKIELAFLYYGRFVDWGVGNGIKLKDVAFYQSIRTRRRKPKQWYSTVLRGEITRLVQILEQKYALKSQIAIVNKLSNKN